jgi:hypothetical protein
MRSDARLDAYSRFLDEAGADPATWRALPREVSAWWRRRAASSIVEAPDGHLRIDGPAADEARIVMLGGRGAR